MKIGGLPLHFLVVHAAVVLTPLAVALACVFAVVPRWRYLTRWPAAVSTLLALVAVWASRLSGDSFLRSKPELGPAIRAHQERGNLLSLLMIAFTVLLGLAVWSLGGRSGLVSGAGARVSKVPVLERVLPWVVVVAALLVLVWVVLTGEAGARAVWG